MSHSPARYQAEIAGITLADLSASFAHKSTSVIREPQASWHVDQMPSGGSSVDRVHRFLKVYTVLYFLAYLALGVVAFSNVAVVYYSAYNFHLKTGLYSMRAPLAYVRYGLLLANLILAITMLIQELFRKWTIVLFALFNLGMFMLMTIFDVQVLLFFIVSFAPVGFYVWKQHH